MLDIRDTEDTEFLSASSSPNGGSSDGSEPGSPAGSTCSSVDSEELQALLEELQIVPPRKRRLGSSEGEGSDGASSPTSRRPTASPRLEGGRRPAPPPAAAAAGSRAPSAQGAAQPAAGPEVIDLLDSSDEDASEDEGWRISAPATAQRR